MIEFFEYGQMPQDPATDDDAHERTLIYIAQMLDEVAQWSDARLAQHGSLIKEVCQSMGRITARLAERDVA